MLRSRDDQWEWIHEPFPEETLPATHPGRNRLYPIGLGRGALDSAHRSTVALLLQSYLTTNHPLSVPIVASPGIPAGGAHPVGQFLREEGAINQ